MKDVKDSFMSHGKTKKKGDNISDKTKKAKSEATNLKDESDEKAKKETESK